VIIHSFTAPTFMSTTAAGETVPYLAFRKLSKTSSKARTTRGGGEKVGEVTTGWTRKGRLLEWAGR